MAPRGNTACRMVRTEQLLPHSQPLLKVLHWLPVSDCIKYKLSCMGIHSVSAAAMQYFAERLTHRHVHHGLLPTHVDLTPSLP